MKFTDEQKKVIEGRGKNILVSAAAGSGKTAVLTERIIGRVLDETDPVDIDRILTVTFTNAAASEMRERIRNRLNKEGEEHPENVRIREQQSLINNASIMTIDSFCARVIRDNFSVIGIDPSFRVGDDNETGILREDACDEILNEAYEEGRKEFYELLEQCSPGKEDKDIAGFIMQLSKAADARPDSEGWLASLEKPYRDAAEALSDGTDPVQAADRAEWALCVISFSDSVLRRTLSDFEKMMDIIDSGDGPYMYKETLEKEKESIEKIMDSDTYSGRYEAIGKTEFGRLPGCRDKSVDEEKKNRVQNIRKSIKDRITGLKKELFIRSPETAIKEMASGHSAVKELVRLTMLYRERYREKKESINIIDFSDVEHLALKILKSGSADDYRELYREVMTDEYQDSNSIQEEILTSVARDDGYFCVGDVKQSIYSFRLAEPGIFMKRYRDYEDAEKSERILLNKNFRSRKAVLDPVNCIFRTCMHEDVGGIEYTKEQELYPGADYDEDSEENKAEFILLERDSDGDLDKIEEEASYVASRINEMAGSFTVTERDGDNKKTRKAGYSDFAILLRSVDGKDEVFRDILKSKGIPAVTETKTGYFKTPEVRHILNILTILDNPRQDIPLIAVLKSSFGGFKDDELSKIRSLVAEKPFYDALMQAEVEGDLEKKRDSFSDKLNELRDMLPYTSIHELIRMLISKGYSYEAEARGGRASENLELLIKRAAEYEKTGYRGLFRFIRYIERMKKSEMDFGEAGISEESGAVRIMSIHKSKGLEFPVVFICNMSGRFNMMDRDGALITDKELGMGLNLTDQKRKIKLNPILKDVIARRIELNTIGEEIRIFYVAATRAKEKLIMTGTVTDPEKAEEKIYSVSSAMSYTDLIMNARNEASEDFSKYILYKTVGLQDLVLSETEKAVEDSVTFEELKPGQDVPSGDLSRMIDKNLSWKYDHEAAVKTLSKVSVSELKKRAMEEEGVYKAEDIVPLLSEELSPEERKAAEAEAAEEAAEREKRREEASIKGTAFHKVMAMLTPGLKPEEAGEFIDTLIERKSLLSGERDLINIEDVSAFLKSELWTRMSEALNKGALFREQPFIMGKKASEIFPDGPDDESVQIQGIIDAFFEEDGKIVVMDYKTDKVGAAGTLVKRYRKQLQLYSDALLQILNKPVTEMIIYSVCLKEEIRI